MAVEREMIVKRWSWAALAVIAGVLAGCSSIPAKVNENDSLVVIKTEFINPDRLPRGYEVRFHYSRGYDDSWVGQYSWDFSILVVRDKGVTLESVGTQLQSQFRGKTPVGQVNLPLPYDPGQVVIADFVFSHKIEKTGEREQTSSFGFRRITPEEKDALMAELKADERFTAWLR